jgi:VanZ family protein
MALIFAFSHQPTLGGAERIPDVLTHGTGYGMLAFLMARAMGTRAVRSPLSSLIVVAASTLYGVTDELHQAFVPGRHCDPWDVLKDLGGSVCGVLVFRRLASSGAEAAGA